MAAIYKNLYYAMQRAYRNYEKCNLTSALVPGKNSIFKVYFKTAFL
jgi:hypothetical protein